MPRLLQARSLPCLRDETSAGDHQSGRQGRSRERAPATAIATATSTIPVCAYRLTFRQWPVPSYPRQAVYFPCQAWRVVLTLHFWTRSSRRSQASGMRYGLLVMAWILGLALLPGTVRTVGGTFGPPLVPTRFDDPIPDGCVADDCSLREAIIAANEEDNLVKVDLPAGTYTLSIEGREEDLAATGDLDLVDRLWLSGAGEGETIIEAEGIDRVFDVGAGNIEISGLTIRGGHAQTPDLESGSGGGLFVGRSATLTLVRVTVLENAADGQGGGIYNASDSLTLIECTITGNREGSKNGFSVPGGGGIHNIGEATLIETTVSDNVARGSAGGISNTGSMTLIDSRVVGNTAAVGGGIGNGGGIATLMLTTLWSVGT